MRKILLLAVICILVSGLVFAQGQKGVQDSELEEAGQGSGQGQDSETQGTSQGQDNETQGAGQETQTETQQQNQGEETRVQAKVKAGEYTTENGKKLEVQERVNNRLQLKSGEVSAQTSMEMVQEQTKLKVKLSNGKDSEIKIMPDTASERALERLRLKVCSEENNCTIELKEVGSGEQVRAAYEVQVQKQARFLGLFKTKMQVQAQVDAETGEVIQTKKPWWAFLASESEE